MLIDALKGKNQSYYFIILSVVLTIVPGFCLQHGSGRVISLNIKQNNGHINKTHFSWGYWSLKLSNVYYNLSLRSGFLWEGGWVGVCWSITTLSLSVWGIWGFNRRQPLNVMGVTGADAPSTNSRDGDETPLCCSPLGQWQLLPSHRAAKVLCAWVCVSVLQVSMGVPDGGDLL